MDNDQKIDKQKTSSLCALCGNEGATVYFERGKVICEGHKGAAELKSILEHTMNLFARLDSVISQIEKSELGILKKKIQSGIDEAAEQMEKIKEGLKK